ncbi:unnamed protein product [Urochloa humidicola]
MDDSDVGIWHQYLDFAEEEGDHGKVIGLYERCLISCATCPHIWMRYVEFLEDANMITDASATLSRALKLVERESLLEICHFSAKYKERIGDIHGARQQYHEIYSKINPVSHEALEAHANFEHRLGDHEKACSAYEDAITAERKLGKVSDLPALLVKYAFFAYAVLENPNKSRQILSQLDNFNLTHPVLKAVIDLSSNFPEKDMFVREFLDPLVQKYLLSDLNDGGLSTKSERKEISLIYLDFLDNFGDINSISVALTRHISLFRE